MRLKVGIFVLTASTVGLLLAAESSSKPAAKSAAPAAKSSAPAKPAAAHAAGGPTQAAFDKSVKPI
ncbi:MAG TPA: hypothetical protein VHC90_18110, partial [Bryobacteraceae bacterium]|nr:hypothetical protein [Bryobacteraceae bacterium]